MAEEQLTNFRWTVPVSGVHVMRAEVGLLRGEAEAREAEVLAVRDPAARAKFCDPMQEPGLLETLARLPLEAEAFADFATRFGLLGLDRVWVPASARHGRGENLTIAELVSDWRAVLEEWQDAFALWGACSTGSTDYLHELLTPLIPGVPAGPRLKVGAGYAIYRYSRESGAGSSTLGGPKSALAPLLNPRKPLRAAKLALGECLNAKLRELTAWRVVFDAKADELALRASPRSLLGAAWLLLAEAASGGRLRARRCRRCDKWIVADARRERRFARVYCGPTCRVAMAEKKGRARELRSQGKTVAEVAETLGQDVKVIRAWLRNGATAQKKGRA